MERQPVVHVEKAALPLNGGSVQEFLSRLRIESRDHVRKKLNLDDQVSVWDVDVFGDHLILEVQRFSDSKTGAKSFRKLFTVTFAKTKKSAAGVRQGAPEFDLGDPVEVVRRVTYVPKVELQKRNAEFCYEKTNSKFGMVSNTKMQL